MSNAMNQSRPRGQGSGGNYEDDQRAMFDAEVRGNDRFKDYLTEFETYQKMLTDIAKNGAVARLEEELKNDKLSAEERKRIEDDLLNAKQEAHRQAMDATKAYTDNTYKNASAQEKARLKKDRAEKLAAERKRAEQQYATEYALAAGDSEKRRQLTLKHNKEKARLMAEENKARAEARKLDESAMSKQMKDVGSKMKNLVTDPSLKNVAELTKSIGNIDGASLKAFAADSAKRYEEANKEQQNAESELADLIEKNADEEQIRAAQERLDDAKKARNEAAREKMLADALNNVADSMNRAYEEVESMIKDYKGHIDARLQGSEKSYNEISNLISSNLSISPYVKTQKVLENMRELVDKGVAYNVEQRAFLQTVSDKIANTFDAFDANLLRLIRLQQADTTAARLGMEASLTKFLNGMFQDTSYLSDMYDTVSSAIIDANASMTRDMSAQFEFIVQKWLGSLASVGMSSETINQIATGLNYLATGDVTNLTGNTQLNTLMAMSASKAGLSFSDLLIKGLDASSTNRLLEGMLTYLKEIAENSDNQVVRAAYGDVFNLSMSDMKAISNLSTGDISSIASKSLSYGGMESELSSQFSQLISRTHITEMLHNVYENAIFGVAEDLMSDPVSYAMYKMLHFMEEEDIDMNIPFINVMGFGLDLNTTVRKLMNMGLQLSSGLALAGNILSGLGSRGGLDLSAWGGAEYTSRGSANAFTMGASQGETSQSTYVSNNNSEDIKNSTMQTATDDAEETKEITNKNTKTEHTFDDFYKVVIEGSEGSGWVRTEDTHIKKAFLDMGSSYIHTRDSRLTFTEKSLKTYDTNLHKVFGSKNVITSEKYLSVFDYALSLALDKQGDSFAVQVYDHALAEYNADSASGDKLAVRDESLTGMQFNEQGMLAYVVNMAADPPTAASIGQSVASKIGAIPISVKASNTSEGMLVRLNQASQNALKSPTSVSISSMPSISVNIDYDRLANEIAKKLGANSSDSRATAKTIGDLYALFTSDSKDDGKAHVRIQNEDGGRLQVDTEASGNAYVAAPFNNTGLNW